FSDAAQLNAYIRAAMPFWRPGSLTEEEAWRVTAFLLRQNDLWDGEAELDASNAPDVKISGGAAFLIGKGKGGILPWAIGAGIFLFIVSMFILKKTRNTTTI
ncbi:MAG TPA: hypothetical protein VHP14_25975, partial [Anaerolineales bacterium]|nr:hypothetical protein [Anaerolineales bacterium]